MSNCLHVCVKHEIEYGAYGFNWEIDGVKGLLTEAGCSVFGELNEDAIGDWEIDEFQFKEAVKKIRRMSPDKIAGHFSGDYVGNDRSEFKKRVTGLLQNFVEKGDHRGGYYHFSWF